GGIASDSHDRLGLQLPQDPQRLEHSQPRLEEGFRLGPETLSEEAPRAHFQKADPVPRNDPLLEGGPGPDEDHLEARMALLDRLRHGYGRIDVPGGADPADAHA